MSEQLTQQVLEILHNGKHFKQSAGQLAGEIIELVKREVETERKGRLHASRGLYLLLQLKHRGIFQVSDQQLLSFGFDPASPIKTMLSVNYDPEKGVHTFSVPADERRTYVLGEDEAQFFNPLADDDKTPYFAEEETA